MVGNPNSRTNIHTTPDPQHEHRDRYASPAGDQDIGNDELNRGDDVEHGQQRPDQPEAVRRTERVDVRHVQNFLGRVLAASTYPCASRRSHERIGLS